MNKLTTLAAISMFAVMMGVAAMSPAMAVPKGNQGAANAIVCHYFQAYMDEDETIPDPANSIWALLWINANAIDGHTIEEEGHEDLVFEGDVNIQEEVDAFAVECNELNTTG